MHRILPLLLLAAAACGRADAGEPPPAPAVAVRTEPVASAEVARPVVGTGVLGAREEVRLSFKVGGIIAGFSVDEGARVRAGQTLASLDLAEIDAQVRRATQAAQKAERDLARARALYADSVATLEQVQDAATAAEVARSDLQVATVNRRYAVLTAPSAGTVLRRQAEAGELAAPGATVLVVAADGGGPVLRVGVPDRDVVRVARGDAATVRFDAYPGEAIRGRVVEIAAAADARTGTYEVEVAVEPEGRALSTGMIGRVEVAPSRTRRLHLVPVEALLEAGADSATVYTLAADGRTARRLRVAVGFLQGDRVAVEGGLDGVAEVVTDGAAYLDEGTPVRKEAAR